MSRGSLTIVGTGFLPGGHVTAETMAYIRQADQVFTLADSITERWLASLNPTAESLRDAYAEGKSRRVSYEEMADRILAPLPGGAKVCAVFYGHPGVFVLPSHQAIQRAREMGFQARMLPAVSAEDCLFADLGVDPAGTGLQSFEATDFLLHPRVFDSASALVLWQIGAIGVPTFKPQKLWSRSGLGILTERLLETYPRAHEVVVYTNSGLPICDPQIDPLPLAELPHADVSTGSTLWIPPARRPKLDQGMRARLGLSPRAETLPQPLVDLKRSFDRPASKPEGQLTFMGLGYKVAGQVGAQTHGYLEMVDRLFYLVTDSVTAHWLEGLHPAAESLTECYKEGERGSIAAAEMLVRILESLREGLHVGVAFSGHPAIGLWISQEAVRLARRAGYRVQVLPAISFEDCLIADLGADPAHGRAMYDATDFLLHPRQLDPSTALVLLQVGVLGESLYRKGTTTPADRMACLTEALMNGYPEDHRVTLYRITTLLPFEPSLQVLPLKDLPQADLSPDLTLYVPRHGEARRDLAVAQRLGYTTTSS